MRTITVDPGATTGWAVWEGTTLVSCGSCAPDRVPDGPFDVVVVEWPRQRREGGASSASLITLGVHLGQALARTGTDHVRRINPSEWKGSIPKPASRKAPYIVATRARGWLLPGEPAPDRGEWDVWDAIGIGLVHHGRCRRGLV